MRIPTLVLCLLAAPAAASHAQTRHWKEIGKTSAGNSVFVDPRSVKNVKGIVSARVRVKFTNPVPTREGNWVTSQHSAMFNCAKSSVASKENVYYSDEKGSHVVKRDKIAIPGFGPALGGSMAKVALDYLCKG
jgi:hypothetical protein